MYGLGTDENRRSNIAGAQHPASRITAKVLDKSSNLIHGKAANWWGFRQVKHGLENAADHMAHQTGKTDGPVQLSRAKLKGVDDFVVLPVDHASMFSHVDGNPPAAWTVIRDRLAR